MKKNRETEAEIRARVAKAPLWIQDLAETLFKQRDEARAELAEHKNNTKPSPFYVRNYGGGDGPERCFIQTKGSINVEHAGISVEVSVGRSGWDANSVHVRFDAVPSGVQDVVVIPLASNCIDIRAAQHLRHAPARFFKAEKRKR